MPAAIPIGAWEDPSFLAFCHPKIARLFCYWDGKRCGRRMPAPRDIDPIELREWLGKLNLFDVLRAPLHFRFHLVGTDYIRLVGSDPTGHRFGWPIGEQADPSSIAGVFFEIVQRRIFRFWNHPAGPEMSRLLGGDRLCLPLADEGEE